MIRLIDEKDFSISEFRKFSSTSDAEISQRVRDIISDVRQRGDKALFEYTARFDSVSLEDGRVSKNEMQAAIQNADKKFLATLERSAQNIRDFHINQKRSGFVAQSANGTVMGQRVLPLERVGLYVPGGTASYPSSVLMNAIPAKIAGVKEICITTPARKDGSVNADILLAAYVAGVDEIYKFGGAQAIAAMAYGTETVKKVDKITGPGNAYVAEAKRQVFGAVSIDMIAGPSEILIIADEGADSKIVASDLLSQAEHDKMATSILITPSKKLALSCQKEIEKIIPTLERSEIARSSIDTNGIIIISSSINSAIAISEKIAPEHLELQVAHPFDYLMDINNAGSLFLGYNTPEALGDYMAGANHVLPTSGSARFSSPLGVDDFVKKMQYTYFSQSAFENLKDDVASFALREGLGAHALSALVRSKK